MSAFRDGHSDFTDADAQVLGISTDDIATQKKFAAELKTPFPMLADPDGKIATAYGVFTGKYAKRVTFIIDQDGKITDRFEGSAALDPAGALAACRR